MSDPRDEAAVRFEAIAAELEQAAAHCRSTAAHFRERTIPRTGAHAFAAHGHLVTARSALDRKAETFAARAVPYVPAEQEADAADTHRGVQSRLSRRG